MSFKSFFLLGVLVGSLAQAADFKNIKALIERHELQSASALVNLRLTLDEGLAASEKLRLILLQAALDLSQKNFIEAKTRLSEARSFWQSRLNSDPRFLAEIELSEFDALELEKAR